MFLIDKGQSNVMNLFELTTAQLIMELIVEYVDLLLIEKREKF